MQLNINLKIKSVAGSSEVLIKLNFLQLTNKHQHDRLI